MRIPLLKALLFGTWVLIIWGCEDQEPLDPAVAAFNTDLASFDGQIHIAEGYAVDFSEFSRNASSWHWTFEGGTPGSHQGRDPSAITYYEKGKFDVQLIVNEGDHLTTDTLVKEDYIKVVAFDEVKAFVKMEYYADGKLTVWNEVPGRYLSAKLVENHSNVYGRVFTYNEQGKISSVHYHSPHGLERQQLNEYDNQARLIGYQIFNGFGEIEETLEINYEGNEFISAYMQKSDGLGGLMSMNVIYHRDFENNLFVEEYRDPADHSYLGSVEYHLGKNRNPYYNMGCQQFPVSEFRKHVVRKQTFDSQRNLVSETIEQVLESDQLGLPVTVRRLEDGVIIFEVARDIEYEFD